MARLEDLTVGTMVNGGGIMSLSRLLPLSGMVTRFWRQRIKTSKECLLVSSCAVRTKYRSLTEGRNTRAMNTRKQLPYVVFSRA